MHPVTLTDEQVAAAARGEPAHQQSVLAAIMPQVRFMIHARLHPSANQAHLAEDLVQEVMASMSAGLTTLQRQTVAGLKAFAATVASRSVAHAIEGRGVYRKVAARSLDSAMVAADMSAAAPLWSLLSASGGSPLSQADQAREVQRVLEELHNLKPEHREVITLAFFDQLETRDIAEHLGLSRPAASMLLMRAVNTLRRNLTGSSRIMLDGQAAGNHER